MSSRGRGGRGGRGRGGMPTSQARLLLQKSATETGLDERTAISLARPAHYPDMMWHSSGSRYLTPEEEVAFRTLQVKKQTPPLQMTKRTTAMTFLVRKQRQLLNYFQKSPQFVQHVPPHMDITRYHDENDDDDDNNKKSGDQPDRTVRQALGKLATTEHFPEELLGTNHKKRKSRKRRRNADGTLIDLDEFVKKERRGAGSDQEDDEDDEDEDDDNNLDITEENGDDDEDEDDNADYTTNYYESEDESDGGGDDGEPTY